MADIRITFRGEDYLIPDTKHFACGLLVEKIMTLGQINAQWADPQFGIISQCYGAMLRFAGCKASDADVWSEMMDRLKSGHPGAGRLAAMEALTLLGSVLMNGAPTGAPDSESAGKTKAS